MENLLCIKGRVLGKGKPLVCVPVMGKTKEEIIKEALEDIGYKVVKED